MSIENQFKQLLKKGLEKLFDIDKLRFNSIIIKKDVIENIIELSKNIYPKEFLAFFQGEIKKEKLIIDKLVYHEYLSSENSATPIFHFADKSFYGSVHSHPSYSNRPSKNDTLFFRKTGIIHCIICKPFIFENLKFYNHHGEEIIVTIED